METPAQQELVLRRVCQVGHVDSRKLETLLQDPRFRVVHDWLMITEDGFLEIEQRIQAMQVPTMVLHACPEPKPALYLHVRNKSPGRFFSEGRRGKH